MIDPCFDGTSWDTTVYTEKLSSAETALVACDSTYGLSAATDGNGIECAVEVNYERVPEAVLGDVEYTLYPPRDPTVC